jgi:hypothetical protein
MSYTGMNRLVIWLSILVLSCLSAACSKSRKPGGRDDAGLAEEGESNNTTESSHLFPGPAPAGLTNISFSLEEEYRVGDTVKVDVIVENPSSATIEGTLEVSIGIDEMRSMIFPDDEIALDSISITVSSNSSEVYSFTYTLPVGISDRKAYVVIASLEYDDRDLGYDRGLTPFGVSALYRAELTVPSDLQECEEESDCHFEIDLNIENVSSELITGIRCEFDLPFGVQNLEGGKEVVMVLDRLRPDEKVMMTAQLKVVEPNEVANFSVAISSDNGGDTGASKSVEITPLEVYY